MEIPVELIGLIEIGAGILATVILTQLSKAGLNLEGQNAKLAAAIVSGALVLIKAVFDQVPLESQSVVSAALQFALVLLGSFGAYKAFISKK